MGLEGNLGKANANVIEGIGTSGRMRFIFETEEAKKNFEKDLTEMHDKTELIKKNDYRCGDCAAHPCFRMPRAKDIAGLCFQIVRECRSECDYFSKDEGSGKSPEFQITGICKKDNYKVLFEQECHIPEYRNSKIK